MKHILGISLFALLLVVLTTSAATAQTKSKTKKKKKENVEEYFDERGSFKDRLWYGANGGGGLGGNENISAFQLTIVPMVGYKITDYWSAGPRIGLGYTYLKGIDQFNTRQVVQPLSYTLAAFSRLKFLRMFFLHAEYGLESTENAFQDNYGRLIFDTSTGKVLTERTNQDIFNVGLGYNAGDGGIGYEIAILYKVLEPKASENLPFDFRIGLTYKF